MSGQPMTAAGHYAKSVELLEAASDAFVLDDDIEGHNARVAAAQVHATLALTCTLATALEPLARANLAGRN